MNILVLGATGYLGGRISEELGEFGHSVVCAARRVPKKIKSDIYSRFVKVDVFDRDQLRQLLDGVDVVVHSAGPNALTCIQRPEDTIEFYKVGTSNLCSAAKAAGVKKLFFLSTAHVYASSLVGFFDEYTNTLNPHPYARCNVIGEIEALKLRGSCTNPYVFRLSNCFGRPALANTNCWNLFVNDICRSSVVDGLIEIKQNPLLQRDFLPIKYLTQILNYFINSDGNHNIYNVGSGSAVSLIDMAKRVRHESISLLNIKPKIKLHSSKEKQETFVYSVSRLFSENPLPTFLAHTELRDLLSHCHERLLRTL